MVTNETIDMQKINLQFDMDFDNELGCVIFGEITILMIKIVERYGKKLLYHLLKILCLMGLSTAQKSSTFCKWIEAQQKGNMAIYTT